MCYNIGSLSLTILWHRFGPYVTVKCQANAQRTNPVLAADLCCWLIRVPASCSRKIV